MVRLFSQYVSARAFLLLALDGSIMAVSLLVAIRIAFPGDSMIWELYTSWPRLAWREATLCGCFLICAYYNGAYQTPVGRRTVEEFVIISQALAASGLILGLTYFFVPAVSLGRRAFLLTMILALVGSSASRWALRHLWRSAAPRHFMLILGAGKLGNLVAQEIKRRSDLGLELVGFIEAPEFEEDKSRTCSPVLGEISEVERVVGRYANSTLVVAVDQHAGLLPIRPLLRLRTRGIGIQDAHEAIASLAGRISLETIESTSFIFSGGFRRSRWIMTLKRATDVAFSLFGLIALAPVMALAAVVVKLDSSGPSLYRQIRVGRNGVSFRLLKFRTMRTDAESDGVAQWAQKGDPRVTRVGGFLRRYRIDEMPQFINVLRGEMSFVGPRPERPEFVDQLRQAIPHYDERHTVRPGLTGWAQVRQGYGANLEEARQKLEYDLFYLKNVAFFFDLAIVFETLKIILFGRGR